MFKWLHGVSEYSYECICHSFLRPRLSSYLYDMTKNETYHDAAYLSMTFFQSHFYDMFTMNFSVFSYIVDDCNSDNFAQSSDTGIYLDALSVFAHATNNDTLMNL